MYYLLLVGVLLNYSGAIKLLKEAIIAPPETSAPEEYLQIKLFVVGVAATFGSIYLYIFFHNEHIFPFLLFGAVLKIWAFITCLYLYMIKRIKFNLFFECGISNGVVAALFIVLLAHHA